MIKNKMRYLWLGILLGGFSLTASTAMGKAEQAVLSITCSTCHLAAKANKLPDLSTYKAKKMRFLLNGYRQGKLGGTVMTRIMKGYSEKEIEIIIANLSKEGK